MIRVGVDVGGTFTDIVLERSGQRGDQQVVVTKVSSTLHDQSEGVVEGILKICRLAGIEPGAIDAVFHGTTVASNMVIERSGAEVGMITTRGFPFRDQSCEIITLRVVATVEVDTLKLPKLAIGGRKDPADPVLYARRTVFDDGKALETPRYRRDALLADDRISGPALVVQHNSTTLIPPGYAATVMAHGDMLVSRG